MDATQWSTQSFAASTISTRRWSYLDKIESFEAARGAAFPWLPTARRE